MLSVVATQAEEIAWAAGLFEGEGCIAMNQRTLVLRVVNTDEDVIERFWDIVGVGGMYGPYAQERNRDGCKRKLFWAWLAQSDCALEALQLLSPWLSRRRLDRAEELTGLRFPVKSPRF
jgi:hypothetical protein